ncbi:4-hydroxy-tetrahydrodipicolinate synthase [Pseudobdellovibrio sp. HCB154]|uniref:4-hydroxy-tetrahydrodipicolinate synthase n=1 Tax=Pseudobdellovibrio sp. HCB154 TaxID=3386277 RepID=UPI0039172F1A
MQQRATDFNGAISALVTPFLNGEVDYASLEKLVAYQLDNGIKGFVVNGTTAESPTLTSAEVSKIFSMVRAQAGVNFPIILGTGSNSTAKTVETTKKASELGANAALVVVPYYNKPPQRGLVEHFKAVAKDSEVPVILYNVPGRTITGMTVDTIAELAEVKNILGIKEATGDIKFDQELIARVPKSFLMLSGDDPTYIDFLKSGGKGIISVMSNLITKECSRWTDLMMSGKVSEAEADFKKYLKLIGQMYCEANPIPVKWMLYKKGIIKSPEMRLPLVTLDNKFHAEITAEMQSLGLL